MKNRSGRLNSFSPSKKGFGFCRGVFLNLDNFPTLLHMSQAAKFGEEEDWRLYSDKGYRASVEADESDLATLFREASEATASLDATQKEGMLMNLRSKYITAIIARRGRISATTTLTYFPSLLS